MPTELEQSEEDNLVDSVLGAEDGFLISTVTYETPITTVEYLTGESAIDEEENARMKTEQANNENSRVNEDYDDYEMQERLSNDSQMKSFNEDPNDSSS